MLWCLAIHSHSDSVGNRKPFLFMCATGVDVSNFEYTSSQPSNWDSLLQKQTASHHVIESIGFKGCLSLDGLCFVTPTYSLCVTSTFAIQNLFTVFTCSVSSGSLPFSVGADPITKVPPDIGRNRGNAEAISVCSFGIEDHPQTLQWVCVFSRRVVQLGQDFVFFIQREGESVKIGYTVHVLN